MAAPPPMPSGDDRRARTRRAAEAAAVRLDLDPGGALLVREGTAVLWRLPAAEALVRVDDRAGWAAAERQAAVAMALAAADVPAVRLIGHGPQPVVVDEVAVTAWRWEEVLDRTVEPVELGRLARRLHDATAAVAPPDVPAADPLGEVVRRLSVAPDADAEVLVERAERLADGWSSAVDPGDGLVHGDLHAGNVLVTARGPVLADLELAGVGPAAYDLAPTVVAVRRYGAPAGDLDAFLAGYGRPRPAAEVLEPLVAVYELWVTAWAVLNRHLDEAHEREAALRMARWRPGAAEDPSAPTRWTLR